MPMITRWHPERGEIVTIKSARCMTTDYPGGGTCILPSLPPFRIEITKTFFDDETGQIAHGRVLDADAIASISKAAKHASPPKPLIVRFHVDSVSVS